MNLPPRRTGSEKSKHGRRIWIALVILCAIGAAAATRRIVAIETTPRAGAADFGGLDAHFAAKAGMTLLHIVPSLLFVLLVPLQFVSSLRERHPRVHRWTGRVIVGLGVVLGGSALWLSAHPVGGLAESSATIFFGCFFLFALSKAWRHIRNGRVELHREWATRMTAIALGVATTRPIMGVFFATSRLTGLTPHDFFGPADVARAYVDLYRGRGLATNAENCIHGRDAEAPRKPHWSGRRGTLVLLPVLYDAGMTPSSVVSRRAFLAAASTAALVRGAPSKDKLKAGLVGCGGRGTQAVVNLLTGNENVELVAMADVFEDHLEGSLDKLRNNAKYVSRDAGITVERGGKPVQLSAEDLAASIRAGIKVDPEHHFVGFDAFQKLINSDVDIVMLATPPGYRPQHFEAAINAGKHVFTEKPIATDPVGVRRFMAAAKKAEEKHLTVMSGAQRHADREYVETVDKIHNGAIGDIVALNSNYLSGPVFHADARDPKWGDMEWELRNWYSFIWICGDQIVEQHFHNIDFMNWVMGAHPVEVVASGGAAWRPREPLYGNIYDHMSSDFVYPGGIHLSSYCRQYPNGLHRDVSDMIVGTKGRSNGMDMGGKGINPYVQEHIDMIKSITGAGPYINQGMRVAESTMTAIMARESAYSGMKITWDMIMASKQDLQPKEGDYKLQMEPIPLPVPGVYKFV